MVSRMTVSRMLSVKSRARRFEAAMRLSRFVSTYTSLASAVCITCSFDR